MAGTAEGAHPFGRTRPGGGELSNNNQKTAPRAYKLGPIAGYATRRGAPRKEPRRRPP